MHSLKSLWVGTLVALAAVTLQCGSDQGPGEGLTIVPGPMTLEVSAYQQFAADYGGITLGARWYVDGIRGGTPEKGMVASTGLYIAPANIPPGGAVTLRAEAFGDTLQGAEATIWITKPNLAPYVIVSPETSSVWASDSVQFTSQVANCAEEDSVVWSISKVYGNPVNPGQIFSDGLYIAPSAPESKFAILVKATSVGCYAKIGIATIVVYAAQDTFSIEMEAFSEKYDVPGAPGISIAPCKSASGGHTVAGMDKAGEWIKVPVTVPVTGTYRPYLYYQANTGNITWASLEMIGCGSSQPIVTFTLEEGDGMG
jgi:hypothetical protein